MVAALLAQGVPAEQAERDAAHRVHPGDRPSTTLLIGPLTPHSLGALIAMYEHKTAALAWLWGINPFDHGSSYYTDVMKTQALKQALDQHGFTAAFGGARRDEEKSRAKERIYSMRAAGHRWDPKAQRPELWSLPNLQLQEGDSMRVFPLSNWTEADVWQYIAQEQLDIVPLYFAKERPVVQRNGAWIMVDDDRMRLNPDEVPQQRLIRFRTLGCYPLSGAIDSTATTLEEIVNETLSSRQSERQGRAIDHDGAGSMERKKQEGYF